MIGQRGAKARKITIFRGTGGVRADRGISRTATTIPQQVHLWFLSKNALLHNISSMIASCIQIDRHLPAT
jgi:hypothetical protein